MSTENIAVAVTEEVQGWRPASIAKDIATLGSGTFLAAGINTVLVFLIPRLVSVEDYGYWRLFGLYAGYVGFLHLGFPDGALLRWAGRPFASFHHELRQSFRFQLLQQLTIVVPLSILVALVVPERYRFIALGVLLYALILNPSVVLQYGLQSARRFRPVAAFAVMGPTIFLLAVVFFGWGLKRSPDFRELIVFYTLAWASGLTFLFLETRPWRACSQTSAGLAKECLIAGWPILLANSAAVLNCSLDRLALSWTANIHNFAQYSLAAGAMAVPITGIQASSKVLFPHLAGLSIDSRKRVYRMASRSLLIAWALLLPYYFALDLFVRRILPKYVPSLQVAKILLLGILFIALIQILQAAFAYLYGRQIRFLMRTVCVLALGVVLAYVAAFQFGSLRDLAVVQVVVLATWWLLNEWTLRQLTFQGIRDWARFLGLFGCIAASYSFALWVGHGIAGGVTYYLCIAVVFAFFCREDLRSWGAVFRVSCAKV